jgi:hypothetical protein
MDKVLTKFPRSQPHLLPDIPGSRILDIRNRTQQPSTLNTEKASVKSDYVAKIKCQGTLIQGSRKSPICTKFCSLNGKPLTLQKEYRESSKEILSRLNHKNVVRMNGVVLLESIPYLHLDLTNYITTLDEYITSSKASSIGESELKVIIAPVSVITRCRLVYSLTR